MPFLIIGGRRHRRAENIDLFLQHLRLELEIIVLFLSQTLGGIAAGLFLQFPGQDIAHDFVFTLERGVLSAIRPSRRSGQLLIGGNQVSLRPESELLLQGRGGLLEGLVGGLGGVKLVLEIFQLGLRHREL